MNLTAVILIVVCGCLLAVAYALNSVKRTSDVRTVLLELTKTRPDTRAVSLGYDRATGKFRNAVLDQRGNVVTRNNDPYPVTETGDFIVLRDHGRVTYKDDHYTIDGFPLTRFTCPDGYVGRNCDPLPLCGDHDENVYRPLTYRQFNQLRLYDTSMGEGDLNAGIGQRRRRRRNAVNEDIHDRIRVHCTRGGRYELEVCDDNELLNDNLQCEPYDLCEDRLSGYKHNYPISRGDRLEPNEYYTCTNNRSVRTKCSDDDMAFSSVAGTCVVRNQCVGREDATIPVDEHRYIQCRNDTGQMITCSNGIQVDENGRFSCITKLCRPYDLRYEDNVFRYVYGRVTCDEHDRPTKRICEVEPFQRRTYSYRWARPFDLTIENIPSQVYDVDTGTCKSIDPNNDLADIAYNPVVQLAWSEAMSKPHPFDFVKQRYVCDTKFRWDYAMGVTEPRTDEFVDSGAPCQDRSYTTFELPWQNYDVVRYPKTGAPILIGTPTRYVQRMNTDSYWPVYLGNGQYQVTLLDVQPGRIVVTDWIDSVPPLGFIRRGGDGKGNVNSMGQEKLDLLGFGQPPEADNRGQYRWFVIASGRFEPIRVSKTAVQRREIAYEYDGRMIQPNQQELDKWYDYPIFWEKLDPSVDSDFKAATDVTLNRTKGVTISGHTTLTPGLFPLSVMVSQRPGDDSIVSCEIKYRDFSLIKNVDEIPSLVLP